MAIPTRHSEASAIVAGDRTFFVTSATLGHARLLQSERMSRLLIEVLYHYRAERKYRLHEFVIMPDHFHALMTVGSEIAIERAVQFIKGGSSYRANKEFGIRSLWQRGFSEARITTADEYKTRREYIYSNPVRAHLADAPDGYHFCSAFAGYELDASPFTAAKAAAHNAY